MSQDFAGQICASLERSGYVVDPEPRIPGASALAYVHSPAPQRLGFSRVDDYFFIVDGDYPPFLTEAGYREAYRAFSTFANHAYRVPHGLRIRIPNLAIVALSEETYQPEILKFARYTSLNPWYGGETGQVILVELEKKTVISLALKSSGRYPTPGAIPLGHAQTVILTICQNVWGSERAAQSATVSSTTHL